jgi:hypothetical protein
MLILCCDNSATSEAFPDGRKEFERKYALYKF